MYTSTHKKVLVIIFSVLALAGIFFLSSKKADPINDIAIKEASLTYFIDSVTSETKIKITDYDKLGLAGGVDGFNLLKAFPNLLPSDFMNVQAYQGGYSVNEKGELLYTGNAASNSGVILREGMKTLLENSSKRLGMPTKTTGDIDMILTKIR